MLFVNFPITDLKQSIAFYEALGFRKNAEFSNEQSAAMRWDDNFWIMLLEHEFYQKFIGDKMIADPQKYSAALIAFTLRSADAVRRFGETAKLHGGTFYQVDMGVPEAMMFGLEVQDPDGNMLEPVWMAS